MAILLRFNTFLRGKKSHKIIEEPKLEGAVEAVSVKDVTYFFNVTSVDSEWVYLDDLSKAAHHPQVLSLRHSLKLGAVADFHARNNVCRIFKGVLRVPLPSNKESLSTPSTEPPMTISLPEEPFVAPTVEDAALNSSAEEFVSLLTIEGATPPSTPLPEYVESIPEFEQPLALVAADVKLSVAAPCYTRPLRITDFAEVGYLGRGAWGYVHLHRHRGTGMLVAIKSIQKQRVQGKEEQLLREQATLLAASGQGGVLDLLGSFQDGAYFYLVTRYYAGGDLLCMMEQLGTPPEDLLVFYAAQLLVCVERIHARGVVHRDLKPANIFLDKKGNLVLGDFGLATFLYELQHAKHVEFCGTMEYLSRDVWQGRQYSCASDVWAYGAVVFEMAVGRRMWDANTCKSVRHARDKAIGGSVREFLGQDTISRDLLLFLDDIFENDDYDRPTLTALKRHKFFESIDWEALEKGTLPVPITLTAEDEEEMPMAVEPIFPDDDNDDLDDDDDDDFPEFNWTSNIFMSAPNVSPVAVIHIPASEFETLSLEVPEDLVDAVFEAIPLVDDVAIVTHPIPTLTALGFLDIDITEPSDPPVSSVEREEVLATPELPEIKLPESTEDESCSSEDSVSSSDVSSTSSSSDDSSVLLTPTLDVIALPTIAAEPSSPLLCGAFQDMPLYSFASLASFASYPSAVYHTAPASPAASPSQSLFLPGGDAKRSTVVCTPAAPIAEAQRAQIVRVFGEETDIDHDAERKHFPASTSNAERDSGRRFVDRLKRLSRLPNSLSHSF